ncbi:peptidase [Pseudomonas sp. 250J]|uniref:Protease inhibitor Inh/omp19 family protein n=1 Tax=Pseudomonas peradeniyensis TaxID=2745488 RepID=A0ABT2V801_9PSED|nr:MULTISPECIES: AprI/Inh family metalloprotease inhibitor [Pseudomonas]KNX79041.1 peptidase [Pseudomonas sp. 250J]MCU7237841.1 protease inhibitor Inh/omp19 family protein [Pseudomonas peradeniyensis]MCU7279518.1 protease inhibitor Inh/omp19 family protein [Pseudomonas peradeniyensis]QZA53136.1 protease inhibitor Inh/omp19 family protein [Pseudomonas sp. 2hn]
MKANLRTIALAAVPMMSMTEVVMASSLLLPNAAQLAGRWQLYPEQQQAQACDLRLGATEGEIEGDLECAKGLIGLRPGSWLVTPDTLALVGGDGSSVVHFSREGAQRYAWTTPDGKQLVLERLDK